LDEHQPYGGSRSGDPEDALLEVNLKLLDVPGEENTPLKSLLRALFYDGRTTADYAEKTAQEYRGRYRDIKARYQGVSNPPLTEINLSYAEIFNVSLSGSRLLVISRDWEYYTGGAHGMQEREWFVIDKSVPERLLPEDLFQDSTREHLRAAVIAAIHERGYLKDDNVDLLNFDITGNFFLTPTSMGFSWDPYEIAAYSEGIVSIMLPYEKIEDLLSKRGQELVKDAQKTR
jgi:hypothetical protein